MDTAVDCFPVLYLYLFVPKPVRRAFICREKLVVA
jgi:hypothetical protein